MEINSERLWNRINQLGDLHTTLDGGVNRPAFSQADREAADLMMEWMKDAGLETQMDTMGNIFGRLKGMTEGPLVLTGSHLDSVPNGGRFDGAAGVLAALEVVQTIRENNIQTNLPIEVVIFVNEEGSRFPGGTMGSMAIAGQLQSTVPYEIMDNDGVLLASAMMMYGAKPDHILQAGRSSSEFHAFLELHIEQGKVLEDLNKPVGIVTGIFGTYRMNVRIFGESGHAGATPMNSRKDPMVAAGIAIMEVERIVKEASSITRGTVGYIRAIPGAVNVIPSEVEFTVDLRDTELANIMKVDKRIKDAISTICKQRGLDSKVIITQNTEPVHINPSIMNVIEKHADTLQIPTAKLPSGAGHDAMIMAKMCPSGMIFVRSQDGLSHCPQEFTTKEDLAQGCQLLLHTILEVAQG